MLFIDKKNRYTSYNLCQSFPLSLDLEDEVKVQLNLSPSLLLLLSFSYYPNTTKNEIKKQVLCIAGYFSKFGILIH